MPRQTWMLKNGQPSARSGGAIDGKFPLHLVTIEIPTLKISLNEWAMVVPAETLPEGLDGIATFRFLNSFTYGNFGNSQEFGLEL